MTKELPVQNVQFGDKVIVDNQVCVVKHIESDFRGNADLYATDRAGVDHHAIVTGVVTIVE